MFLLGSLARQLPWLLFPLPKQHALTHIQPLAHRTTSDAPFPPLRVTASDSVDDVESFVPLQTNYINYFLLLTPAAWGTWQQIYLNHAYLDIYFPNATCTIVGQRKCQDCRHRRIGFSLQGLTSPTPFYFTQLTGDNCCLNTLWLVNHFPTIWRILFLLSAKIFSMIKKKKRSITCLRPKLHRSLHWQKNRDVSEQLPINQMQENR